MPQGSTKGCTKIAVGRSMKYRDKAKEVFKEIQGLGLTPLFPNLHHTNDRVDTAETSEQKRRFAEDHYRAIDEAEICYWITIGGRLGTSCILELGYALAKKKPVYFSEPTNDFTLDCYVKEFISVDKLERFTKIIPSEKIKQKTGD